ncbi:hypothetical protein MH122_14035 [Bacillus pumilus]|uniref:hypothetical protein n=1 Tax=Bacillus pumilus TaxID=1408 RepID=UPI0022820282|nr:hypothetical protein [Bacillus pumilus]MCY7679919.1 hypothetical protein [Bacillus pumilus]
MTETKYKTEKRKARIGEQILITNVSEVEDEYENGDVFEVARVNSGCSVDSAEGYVVLDYEYEVIIGEQAPVQNLDEMDYDDLVALCEKVMDALRTRSYKSGYDQGRFDEGIEAAHGTYEKSDQQKRDDIVAQAKEDVETLKMRNRLSKAFTIQVIERPKSRSVEATAKVPNSRKAFYGIAKCAPDDCFNVHVGKAIALRRALGLEVPAEYLYTPQPTEVRVGDIIEAADCCGEKYRFTVGHIQDDKIYDVRGDGTYTYLDAAVRYLRSDATNPKTIDDSRVGEGE